VKGESLKLHPAFVFARSEVIFILKYLDVICSKNKGGKRGCYKHFKIIIVQF